MPSDLGAKSKEMEPTAWPDEAYSWIELAIEVQSSALRAEVGQGLAARLPFPAILELCRPCRGAHWAPVWVKSGPTLAKGSTKTTASGEKGHLAKTILCIRFSYCLGGPWQALGSSGVPVEASQEALDPLAPLKGHKGSIGIYENNRE